MTTATERLDRTFGALADPTRRAILAVSYTHLTLPTKRIV